MVYCAVLRYRILDFERIRERVPSGTKEPDGATTPSNARVRNFLGGFFRTRHTRVALDVIVSGPVFG